MAFDEVRLEIGGTAFGVLFRRRRRTEIARLGNGHEERNSLWAASYLSADLSTVVRSLNDQHEIMEFWEARQGKARGFRLKDKSDFKSGKPLAPVTPTDQQVAAVDGSSTSFQLVKGYVSGGRRYERVIRKPVAGTVRVAVGGVEQEGGWSVDTTTGIITFDSAPSSGVSITAGYEFDVPVRFDTDDLGLILPYAEEGVYEQIPVVEIQS
ncbi:TIGR02217 family protein [Roseovarius sp. SYSU LYC5161]|uniref:phage distal tail protein, Rcc01695 family n=1 Tax=Roseovarius halophilus (ex Wu et al. 2025) TaxID=3376060 RepID=UPI00399AF99C